MAMPAPQQAATTAFWQWLAPRASRLPELEDGASPFWDEVLGRLKAIDDGLWLEIGGGMELPVARHGLGQRRGDARVVPEAAQQRIGLAKAEEVLG